VNGAGGTGALGLLASALRGRRRDLAGLVLWAAVEGLPAYVSGRLIAAAVDRGFLAGRAGTGFALLGLLALSIVIGAWGARQTFRRLTVLVEPFRDELVVATVTTAIHRSTMGGGPPDAGAVARLSRHVEIGREALASLLVAAQSFVVVMGSALLGLLTLVPGAAVLVLPPLLAGFGLFAVALRRMTGSKRAAILADEGLAVSATSMVTGLRDVVSSGGEAAVEREVGGYIDAEAQATRRVARLAMVGAAAIGIGGWLPVVLLLAGGPWLRRHGATAGALLGAVTYVLEGVLPALQSLVRELGETGAWLTVALQRIAEGGATPAGPDGPAGLSGPSGPSSPSGNGTMVPAMSRPDDPGLLVRDLTFRYGAGAEPIVAGLDLVVPAGDHLAVVGPSGSGKSTLVALVAGMLRPERGEVVLGGAPVLGIGRSALAGRRVLIPQEAYVFSGSLRENVAYLAPDVPDAVLDGAVDELGARPLVERIGGYDAELEPASLSAGERQLLSLVRAYVAPAPVVLLDEATCHLDPPAEERAERAFARRGGTLVVVAHRISSALRARRILVLDGAEAVVGTHEDLLAASPLYRDLVGCWTGDAPAIVEPPPTTSAV
jgi:ATP-binding cassette subfamily C protein